MPRHSPSALPVVCPSLVAGLLAALVFVLSLALYAATLVEVHTFDALSYALDVERKPWRELFHPHHLAYGPLGALVQKLASTLFGWQGSAVLPLQITNALAGATGVALFFGLVWRATRRADIALCTALLLGSSYAYWYYAVEVEVYTIAAVLLIGCLWLLLRLLRRPTLLIAALLGVLQAAAVLFHQTNVLLSVAVLVGLAGLQVPWAQRRTLLVAYSVPLGLVGGGAYLLVGFGISAFRSWDAFVGWLLSYAQTGLWGGLPSAHTWHELREGLSTTLSQPGGGLALLLLTGLLLVSMRRLVHTQPLVVRVLVAWLLTYGAFFFWWEPDNIEFWIASLPPALLLLALGLRTLGPPWHAGVWLGLAVAALMLNLNSVSVQARGSGSFTPQREIARALAAQSTPADLLLVPDGLQALYLDYYEGRPKAVALSHTVQTTGGDWSAACQVLTARIDAALASGGAVLIAEWVLYPERIPPRTADPILARFGLDAAQVRACFAPYRLDLVRLSLGAGLPAAYRLPTAAELLAGPGWHFRRHHWGWQGANMVAMQFANGSWSFLPARDPHLTSPLVLIDTARYRAVQVRLAKHVSNREGQLFFLNAQRIVEETRSVRWELVGSSEMTTYEIDVRSHPAWQGTLSGLRLDPTTGPDDDAGERIHIAWLRLVPVDED